ncbi:MAG: hypothetical protein IJG65_04675 [Synergistaceae bacterium]|nr:hypothetical protein [Synergistaceae bacterium]
MNAGYSEEIVEVIRNFLIEDDWKFEFDEERGIFRFGVAIESKLKHLRYFVPVRSDAYTVYAISPIEADSDDKDVIREMAEFICRANYGLRNGNFELDVTDGEIRYKTFVDCDGIIPTEEIIKGSIIIPSVMFDRYAPGMLDVMFKGATAEEAISKCE